ncbi:hypothetical protein [Paenibacillus dendrobii]|uniref:hypothetical protein n=1 Tax=Paenibacillus dendrobii TaxID=2691084 RepID=UPI001921CBE9|nr:hypothetical protein [Paenibacillus dendrobii]
MTVHSLLTNPLTHLSDEILGCMELKQDPLFHKIPEDKIAYYVQASLRAGRVAAEKYKGCNIRRMYREAGLRHEVTDASGDFHQVSFRAQIDFAKKPPQILLYSSSLNGMQRVCRNILGASPTAEPDMDRLIDIHLAHEFYHWLEYREGSFTNERLEPIEVFKLGPYTKRSSVVQCSEIAAHAFCKEVLDLPCLPNLLDYAYLIEDNQLQEKVFEQQLETCKCWISRTLNTSPGVI